MEKVDGLCYERYFWHWVPSRLIRGALWVRSWGSRTMQYGMHGDSVVFLHWISYNLFLSKHWCFVNKYCSIEPACRIYSNNRVFREISPDSSNGCQVSTKLVPQVFKTLFVLPELIGAISVVGLPTSYQLNCLLYYLFYLGVYTLSRICFLYLESFSVLCYCTNELGCSEIAMQSVIAADLSSCKNWNTTARGREWSWSGCWSNLSRSLVDINACNSI